MSTMPPNPERWIELKQRIDKTFPVEPTVPVSGSVLKSELRRKSPAREADEAAAQLFFIELARLMGLDIVKPTVAREARKDAKKSGFSEGSLAHLYRSSLVITSLTPHRKLSPTVEYWHTPLSPPDSQLSANIPPRQSHDEITPPPVHPLSESPVLVPEPSIQLHDMISRGTEEPPPPGEDLGGGRTQCVETETRQNILWVFLCGVAVFLAPVNIVSGMTASHGDNWKLAFVGFFILWLLVGSTWLFLDVHRLQRAPFTKRCLWHLGGCAASLYFFMSIVHITSDNLPQWLPTIMNCGVGVSVGLQNIPSATRNRARDYFSSVISSIFGATQVIIRRDEQQLSERNETTSPRRRRQDIETGSIS